MADVLTFTPRPRLPEPAEPPRSTVRAALEDAVQAALDTADHLIAVLDGMDGDGDDEDGGDAEPSLGAPESHESQVVWPRGGDDDREVPEAPVVDPWATVSPWYRIGPVRRILMRSGHQPGQGNIITAAGLSLLALAER